MNIVYRYRLHPPHANAEAVREQMHRAHDYRNHLIHIARGERAAKRVFIEAMPVVRAAMANAEAATDHLQSVKIAMKNQHKVARKRKHQPSLDDAIEQSRETWRAAFDELDKVRLAAIRTPRRERSSTG